MNTPKRLEFLQAAENHKSFLRRISLLFPTLDPRYVLIENAYNDAKASFQNVFREGGERYFEHVRAVVLIMIDYLRVKDYELIIAGLLHDTVEDDKRWTVDRVRREYGNRVAYFVEYVTKPSHAEYPDKRERDDAYHSKFEFAPREFFLIKLADRWHNVITLWSCSEEKQRRKIEETRRYYLPHAEKHFILYHEIKEALEELERGKADEEHAGKVVQAG